MVKPAVNIRCVCIVGLLLTVSLIASCSGIKPYRNMAEKNLHIKTEANSGSFFSSVRTAVDIYRVNADCKTEYEGTVQLNKPSVDIGIPSNRLSYLVFVFSSSSFLTNTSGTITHNNVLKPRAGFYYEVQVNYKDDIYNVVIQETHPGEHVGRKIGHSRLSACNEFSVDS